MDTLVKVSDQKLEKDVCLSSNDLQNLGVFPTNLQCFTYYNYVLYQKGNKRIILKPLPYDLFRVIRTYEFLPA